MRKRMDDKRNHDVLAADLYAPETMSQIASWLSGKQADLVIERMEMGLVSFPRNIYYLASYVGQIYDHLSEGGLLLAQVPDFASPLLASWKAHAHMESQRRIEIHYSETVGGPIALRLQKHPGAPDTLPVLSPHQMLSCMNRYYGR
jgi:hypothetical protein